MANPFFQPGGQRAVKVSELFARIAPRYDFINDLQSFGLHRFWKRRAIALAAPQPGDRALDVCCGTGDLAFGLARRGASVTGLDFSQPMLAEAEQRRAVAALRESPQFLQADAMQIPFPDETFRIVTMGYGLRNLSNWEAGLRELWRVARPGARLVVLEFGKPSNSLWRAAYFGYLKLVVPWLGRIFCGNAAAYAYILESLKHYPGQEGVAREMRQLGMVNVRIVNFLGGAMSINYAERPIVAKP